MLASKPGLIGDLEIKNRIAMAPMISNLADSDGRTNEEHVKYLEARAAGGTGLIITEYTYVDQLNSRGSRYQMGAFSSSLVPRLKRIPETLHPYGSKVFTQLVHAGGKALQHDNVEEPMAPTSTDYMGYTPREMTENDIESVIRSFENAGRIAKLAGFDGIEIHGAHGYLIHEFLSPTLNLRSDRYGGTFEKRLSVPQLVLDAVKTTTQLPVGIRLSLYEDDPGGFGPDYGLKVAESLMNIDYVHFSAGNFNPPGSAATFYSPQMHIAARLPRKPSVTTMVVGSITDAASVEKTLEKSDFVSIGRGLLADPFFSTKVIEKPDLIRPCIRCNQGCRDLSLGEVRCTVNPDTGREFVMHPKGSGEITIVGAGIQGLEAALYASKAGMKVQLYEESDRVGGQLNRITDPAKKTVMSSLVRYYENALKSAGVEVRLDEPYSGNAVYCLPPVRYDPIPEDCDVFESNIYQHHDQMLEMAVNMKLEVGIRSLNSLDRGRRAGFESIAKKVGIKFVENADFKFSRIVDRQYDILSAMRLGRAKVREHMLKHSNDYL